MKYQLSEQFRRKYKKQNVRIKKAIDKALEKFYKNHFDPQLDNHSLKKKLQGLKSIDITANYRAVYEEIEEDDNLLAYFENFGTHKELFESAI